MSCYLTKTTATTKDIVSKNLHLSPMYLVKLRVLDLAIVLQLKTRW